MRCDLKLNLYPPVSLGTQFCLLDTLLPNAMLNLGDRVFKDSIYLLSRNYLLMGSKTDPKIHSKHKIKVKGFLKVPVPRHWLITLGRVVGN